ncbi:MAG TPA: hypothetical protein VIN72_05920 [Lutibacter sp.]
MTDKEFKNEALIFFRENGKYYNINTLQDITSDAYNYVRKSKIFKYKDRVEADVLVSCLVELGYIEYIKKENNVRYHSLTKSGFQYIQDLNK